MRPGDFTLKTRASVTTPSLGVIADVLGLGDLDSGTLLETVKAFAFDEEIDEPSGLSLPNAAPIATLLQAGLDMLSGKLSDKTLSTEMGQKILVRVTKSLLAADKKRRSMMRAGIGYPEAMFAALTTTRRVTSDQLLERDLVAFRTDTMARMSQTARSFVEKLVF